MADSQALILGLHIITLKVLAIFRDDDKTAFCMASKTIIIIIVIIIIIIIIITSETGITIYNYKSHRKLVNVKRLKKKK